MVETRVWSMLYGQVSHWNCCARSACPTDGCSNPKGLSADSQTASPSSSPTLLPLVASLRKYQDSIISLPFSNSSSFQPKLGVMVIGAREWKGTSPTISGLQMRLCVVEGEALMLLKSMPKPFYDSQLARVSSQTVCDRSVLWPLL